MLSRKMKRFAAVLVVVLFAVPWQAFAAAAPGQVGQIIAVTGDVKVTRAGATVKAVLKGALQPKDVITTGADAFVIMKFTDESTVSLSENAKFTITEFAVRGEKRTSRFFLSIGRMVADVKKFIGGGSTFDVDTPTAVAGVRGTGFELVVAMVGTQMTTTVSCTVGALSVSALSATGAVISTATIVAGQTAVITSAGITVSAASAVAGAGAATTTGTTTTVTTATGAGTVSTTGAAAGTAGAATAGTAAGTATVAGVGVGTAAAGAVAAAAVVTAVATATTSDTPTSHTTPSHH